MKIPKIHILSFCVIASFATAQDITYQKSGYYSFQAAEILTRNKGKATPIIGAEEKGIYIRKGKKGQKRMSWSVSCSAQPVFSVSSKFISIEDLDYRFFYRKDAYHEEAAYQDMRTRNRETQHKVGMLQGTGNDEAIVELLEEQEQFEENMETLIEDGDLELKGHADSIELTMKIQPNQDIDNAYLAVMASHQNLENKLRVAVSVEWIGDLLKDIPEEVTIRKLLAEGNYQGSRVELFLFSGDATPIPTTLSRSLKELSMTELENLVKLQGSGGTTKSSQ